jgi:chromosomal replication initiator protein
MVREYVGSEENRLVQHAVHALLDRSGLYNPLIFYGSTGTGKSFLALGLAERWRSQYPEDKVVVTCGPDFARSFANAVDTDNLVSFRKRARSAQLFVLDDIHLLKQKRAAQLELARAIDALIQNGGAVLLTDQTAPTADTGLVPALRSRLAQGLAVRLTPPGASARRYLLERLAAQYEIQFDDAAIELLSNHSLEADPQSSTVLRLRHAVIQLAHGGQGRAGCIDVEQVRHFLREQETQRQPTLRAIAAAVSKHFAVTGPELRGPSRRRNVVRARGVAMLLAWTYTGKSLEAVGQYFGNRDHTTVLHACRKTDQLRQSEPAIAQAWEDLLAQLHFTSEGRSRTD